jgi:hypothetical protein
MHELDLGRDVRAGVREAWYYVKLYMLQAVIAIPLGGYVLLRRFPLLAIGLFPMYIVGALTGGAIVGYLLPWCKRPLGAAVTGIIAILPLLLGLTLLMAPAYEWRPVIWIVPVIGAIGYGGIGGIILYRSYTYGRR